MGISLCNGCSVQTPISKLGENYICNGRADYWKEWGFGEGGIETRTKCEQAAHKFCSEKSKNNALILKSEYVNSGFAWLEVKFSNRKFYSF
jgi:hypothetical protein